MEAAVSLSALATQIDSALSGDLDRPWCVHRLYEELLAAPGGASQDHMLVATQQAADELVAAGRARREYVSATAIGVHCEDALYWSARSERLQLIEFGPEFESPTLLRRLASHVQCHGL